MSPKTNTREFFPLLVLTLSYLVLRNLQGGIDSPEKFSRITFHNNFPSTNTIYSLLEGELKRDFVVFPGGRTEIIEFSYSGLVSLVSGGLVVTSSGVQLIERSPTLFQRWSQIEGAFQLHDGVVGFSVGNYSLVEPLVIDPLLSFSSFFGGGGSDSGLSVATDGTSIFVGGSTTSTDISGFQLSPSLDDAFLCKISIDSKVVQYCSYFGGDNSDQVSGVAIDNGILYAAMVSDSNTFLNITNKGSSDVFVAWLNPSSGSLLNSATVGGSSFDFPNLLVVDNAGVVVVGQTTSPDFPSVDPWGLSGTPADGFIVRFSSSGALLMANRIGGPLSDNTNFVSVLSPTSYLLGGNSVFSSGSVEGWMTTVSNGIVTTLSIAGVDRSTTSVSSFCLLGGSERLIVGTTTSVHLPVTADAQQKLPGGGGTDCFIARITGQTISYLSYFGGSGEDNCYRIKKINLQYVIAGTTSSPDLIASSNAIQTDLLGPYDCFFLLLDENNQVTYTTYFGGDSTEYLGEIAAFGNFMVVVGTSYSLSNFPVKNAFRTTMQQSEAFISIIDLSLPNPTPIPTISASNLPTKTKTPKLSLTSTPKICKYTCSNSKCVDTIPDCILNPNTTVDMKVPAIYPCSDGFFSVVPSDCWTGECERGKSLCFDGSCVEDTNTCPTLPACPLESPFRCEDGSCRIDKSRCPNKSPPKCKSTLIRCTDTICRKVCLPYDGCQKYQCPDGSCGDTSDDCKGHCSQGEFRCYTNKCEVDPLDCPIPPWLEDKPISVTVVITNCEKDTTINLPSTSSNDTVIEITIPASSFKCPATLHIIATPDSVVVSELDEKERDNLLTPVVTITESKGRKPKKPTTIKFFKDHVEGKKCLTQVRPHDDSKKNCVGNVDYHDGAYVTSTSDFGSLSVLLFGTIDTSSATYRVLRWGVVMGFCLAVLFALLLWFGVYVLRNEQLSVFMLGHSNEKISFAALSQMGQAGRASTISSTGKSSRSSEAPVIRNYADMAKFGMSAGGARPTMFVPDG